MNTNPTARERRHIARIKAMACIVCGQDGPSDAHHIDQSDAFSCLPLCKSCHTGRNGIHGERHMWKLKKLDETKALARTLRALVEAA